MSYHKAIILDYHRAISGAAADQGLDEIGRRKWHNGFIVYGGRSDENNGGK